MSISRNQRREIAFVFIIGMSFLSIGVPVAQSRGISSRYGGVKYGANGQNPQALQQSLQKIGQQLQSGEKVLKEKSDHVGEVRKQFQKVDLEHKQNLRDLAQAKKAAEDKAKNSPEFKSARDKAEALRHEYVDARKKIAVKLATQEGYQVAIKAHEQAIAEQKASSGSEVEAETRKTLAKNVSESEQRIRDLEDIALADDNEAKAIKSKLKEAEAEVAVQSKRKHDALENDPRVTSAKVGFQRTRDALKTALQNLEQANGELSGVRSRLSALANQQAALQAQQRQQSGGRGSTGGTRTR